MSVPVEEIQSVLYVVKYDRRPEKNEAYKIWLNDVAVPSLLNASPYLTRLHGYEPANRTSQNGESQVIVTYEFAKLEHYQAWQADESVKSVFNELAQYADNIVTELWKPSPTEARPQSSTRVQHFWPDGGDVAHNH